MRAYAVASAKRSDPYETLRGRTKFHPRAFCTTTPKRQKLIAKAVRTRFDVRNVLGANPGVVRAAPGDSPDGPSVVLGATLGRPGLPKTLLGRPGRVPERSWTLALASPGWPPAPRSARKRYFLNFLLILDSLGLLLACIFGFSGKRFERSCDSWFTCGIPTEMLR